MFFSSTPFILRRVSKVIQTPFWITVSSYSSSTFGPSLALRTIFTYFWWNLSCFKKSYTIKLFTPAIEFIISWSLWSTTTSRDIFSLSSRVNLVGYSRFSLHLVLIRFPFFTYHAIFWKPSCRVCFPRTFRSSSYRIGSRLRRKSSRENWCCWRALTAFV